MSATEKPVVLIVDDIEDFREFARTQFELFGYRVNTASNYATAVRAINNEKQIMVAFIDIHLQRQGGGSGLDLLRYIVDTASHRVVPYVWTGDESLLVEKEAMGAGAIRVFYKGKDPIERLILSADSHALRLVRESGEDRLTGLDNYGSFRRSVLAEFRRALNPRDPKRARTFTFLFCDLDDFREINKRIGDSAGDQAIRMVAEILRGKVREKSDHPCRKGGDEFIVCMPNVPLDKALESARKIEEAIESSPLETGGGERIKLGISIGIHEVNSSRLVDADLEDAFNEAIDQADKAMRSNKRLRKEQKSV